MRNRERLQYMGLVVMLLVGLGELLTPEMSEASGTTLTLQVDNGTTVNILGAQVTCTDTTNYNQCFAISTGVVATGNNGRSFSVRAAPNAQARLNINDRYPARGRVTGVEFYPTSTAWGCTNGAAGSNNCAIRDEVHVLKVIYKNKYLNAASGGSFTIGLRSGGMWIAGPSTTTNCGLTSTGLPQLCHNQYNRVEYKGTGEFDASTSTAPTPLLGEAPANPSVEQLQELGKTQTTTWTTQLDQDSQYPTESCNTGTSTAPACQPLITTQYTVTLYGPDTVRLNDSNDLVGGGCKVTPADDGVTSPSGPPIPCHANGNKKSADSIITNEFAEATAVDLAAAAAAGAVQAVRCTEADNCPCADPETCMGSIVTKIRLTPTTGVLGLPFQFATVGDFGSYGINPSFTINSDRKGLGSYAFNNILTLGYGPWIIAEGVFPPIDANTTWDTDQIACESRLNKPAVYDSTGGLISPAVIVTTWTVGGTSEKGPLTVDQLGSGDTLTCEWHIHKNSGN